MEEELIDQHLDEVKNGGDKETLDRKGDVGSQYNIDDNSGNNENAYDEIEEESKTEMGNDAENEGGNQIEGVVNSLKEASFIESDGADEEIADLSDSADSTTEVSDNGETPADELYAKTKKQQAEITRIIESTKTSGSTSLDLSNKKLQAVPEPLLELGHLEFIYLEGNEIAYLPDEFFKCFPCLRWLDLRNNFLSRIPSAFLANHKCLRNLLLEGNSLRNLPLELGLVKSLHGLNIKGNPLDFPPQEIIDKGTQRILAFLQEMMAAKNTAQMAELDLNLSQDVSDGYEQISASSDDWNTTASMMDLAKRREYLHKSHSAESSSKDIDPNHEMFGTQSAELHKPSSYTENKVQHIQKLKKAGALGVVQPKKKKSNLAWRVNHYPSPPPQDYVSFKMSEEKQMAKIKDLREKTDAILQRRKDDALLKNWRDDAKVLQQKKYRQKLVAGEDYGEPAEQAPFAVEKEMMRVLTKEERMKEDMRREKEIKDHRAVSPATRQRIEQEKQARIRELEKRIKDHTSGMVERRKQPKGTPQHEMEIARRELEIAEALHNELLDRRKEMEYRFKAFSADVSATIGKRSTHIKN